MYQPETLEVPQELMESFNKQSEDKVKFLMEEGLIDTHKSPYELMIFAYNKALEDVYKKNNGIPSIPFPISLSTVDMLCIAATNRGIEVMLGRKPGQEKWQFPGGFRDPKETSRQAAARELGEEACLSIEEKRLKLIGELFIDDIRYRHTPHKITTQIFLCQLAQEEMELAKPGDDLGEIMWYSLNDLKADTSVFRDMHVPLFNILVEHLGTIPSGVIVE